MPEEAEDMEDLIPPPMSLSLPELFSPEHQLIETLREAVSSTELLRERAMERFYRAVAAEEASEAAKKAQVERKTGELATTVETKADAESEDNRRSSLRRRLSGTGTTPQNLLIWQTKKARRRLSEGQEETFKSPLKFLTPSLLPDVEAKSDPNLPSDSEAQVVPWGQGKEEDGATQLRKWHDSHVPLVESAEEKSMVWQASANEGPLRSEGVVLEALPADQADRGQEEVEEEEEESIETSEVSSEISSADSEDLKLLKARILARQVLEEEDTYHPRGKPILHVETEPPPVPPHRVPILDVSPPTPTASPSMSPTNVVPKSILKKPKEEPVIAVNSFGRPIPPEKPIRKIPPQPAQQMDQKEEDIDAVQEINEPEALKPPVMSESDTDSMMSAAEAAKNRRIQTKMRSTASEEEIDEEDIEARMAMVNHYTEIVREHSNRFSYRSSEERKLEDNLAGSRRSSITEDQDVRSQVMKERFETAVVAKPGMRQDKEIQENQLKKVVKKNEVDRQEKQSGQQTKRSAGSRATTPARDIKPTKEKRTSRPPSRNQSPASRSRNVSVERGSASSRSSSKTRVRAPSQDRRPPSRTGSEDQRYVRERSVQDEPRRSKKPSSRPHSRSSSRDRNRPETPVKLKMERLQKALDSKRYRSARRGSATDRDYPEESAQSRLKDKQLEIEAEKNVRFTVGYVTDLTLLIAAVYVYIFKKETLAIPFIALLLYRRIQHELRKRMSRGWLWSKRKQ